jgi:S-adenosyl-L-methionine hydrolase (adenosine-forming)
MPIITLTSDWGWKDHYLAAVKGQIKSRLPGVELIDISHDIRPFNLKEASFIIRNCYNTFPRGTVHLIAVRTEGPGDNPHMAALYNGHYFICGDNGIFSLIFDSKPEKLVIISDGKSIHPTFTALDSLVDAAVALAEGKNIDQLGEAREEWVEKSHFQPVVTGNIIKGLVIYIDNYENVITNITKDLFEKTGRGRKFLIECRSEQVNRLSGKYTDASPGEVLALFSHTGFLEIAINHDHASGLLGLYVNDSIRVEFFD